MPQGRNTHTPLPAAMVKPIDTAVLPPATNPLDESFLLQTANQNSLTADDTTEDHTTPEASLSHTELEPDADTDFPTTGSDEDNSTSQSTLSGSSFHTTQLTHNDYADSDESQSWQIAATARGTGTIER